MDADVVIVGAGPAGVSAATHLRGFQGRVLILERLSDAAFPRYHSICGEAVSDRMFGKAGIEPGAVVARVDRITITYPGGVTVAVPVKGSVVDRPEMLMRLRSSCGAETVRATVRSVREEDGGYVLDTTAGEVRCRHLIGADGAHSVVRRDLFGSVPEMIPVVNNIVAGEGRDLAFAVGEDFDGLYRWRFPSKPGTVSVGSPKGAPRPEGTIVTGARDLPFGGVPQVVKGGAYLVGDAAAMANALCYGGIGLAMLSGRKAAESIRSGRPSSYGRWYRRCIYTNPHFMEAHRQFRTWTDEDIVRAMEPFRGGYSIPRGLKGIIRHPAYANVYFATWMAFKVGW